MEHYIARAMLEELTEIKKELRNHNELQRELIYELREIRGNM